MHSKRILKLTRPAIWVWLTISCLVIFVPGISRAALDRTESELKLLPRYCLDTQEFQEGYKIRKGYWVSIMGKSFEHMHHYCRAQTWMLRARKAGLSPQERKFSWDRAADECQYIIKNAEPEFIMLPEIYTRFGQVELQRGRPESADKAFAKARQLKPDYWPAYSHWAEYLMNHGQRAEALKIVRSGLQQTPDAKVLRELFKILGGKPSDIPGKPVESLKDVVTLPVEEKLAVPSDPESAETGPPNGDSPLQTKP